MRERMKRRFLLLGMMGICCIVLAAAMGPRPAKPAKPAKPAQQETQTPLQGKIIFIDAGHGGTDGGARAKDSRVWEKELNLQVACALQSRLKNSGATVVMSRETDRQYSENKREDLTARLKLATENNADILVSIHMNEYRSRAESGPQVFYRQGQEQSRLLAGVMQSSLIRALSPAKKRAALAGDYFMLSLSIPSILVECGFISNAAEEKLLLNAEYRDRVAQAIHDGLAEYFSLAEKIHHE